MKTKTKLPKGHEVVRSNGHASAKGKTLRTKRLEKVETPYDRIKHLLGILTELPSDLRTNPKYFEGFGS